MFPGMHCNCWHGDLRISYFTLAVSAVLTLPLPTVCGSVHGSLGPSPFTPASLERHPHRHGWLVLQRLGRHFLSFGHVFRYVAAQAASAGDRKSTRLNSSHRCIS